MRRSQQGRFQGNEQRLAALEGAAPHPIHSQLQRLAWREGEALRHAALGRRLLLGDVLNGADTAFLAEIDARIGWSAAGVKASYATTRAEILDSY